MEIDYTSSTTGDGVSTYTEGSACTLQTHANITFFNSRPSSVWGRYRITTYHYSGLVAAQTSWQYELIPGDGDVYVPISHYTGVTAEGSEQPLWRVVVEAEVEDEHYASGTAWFYKE